MRKVTFVILAVLVAASAGLWLLARQVLASDLTRATLEQQLSARLGRPVHVRAATAVLFPAVAVDLHDVTIGDAPPVRIGRIQVATGLRSLFARTRSDVSIRSLAFRDIVLGTGGETLTVDLDASLTGDRLDVSTLDARAGATKIHARGALTSLARTHGVFGADPLDLAEMISIASALAPSSSSRGAATPMHFVVTVAAPRGQFGAYRFREFTTKLDAVPGRLAFDDLAFQAFGGTFRGGAGADTSGAAPALRLNGQVTGLDMTQLLAGSGSAGGITGRLSAALSLQGRGGGAEALLRAARGTITATIADGTLPHLDMVRRVVLAFGKPSGAPAEGAGTAFKTLGGTFALANGGLASEDIALASRDLDLHGHGSLRLESGAVDARADVVLSPELTAQAGTDLRRYAQQDGRVIVPATVGGTLADPHVSIDVAAAARRAAGNELKRRVTDILGGLFKKKKGGG